MRPAPLPTLSAVAMVLALGAANAQQPASPFGGFKHDNTQPIEITADALEVRDADKQAIFSGSVVAGQGTLRLTADTLIVWYRNDEGEQAEAATPGTGAIDRLRAEGDVFLSSGAETARGAWANYEVEDGMVTMGGGVILSQGDNAVRGERLTVNLVTGVGRVEGGRVQSVFNPASRSGSSP